MLSTELQLYLVVWIIYLSDCLWWHPRSSWKLSGDVASGRMKAVFAGPLGNAKGGFRMLSLLPGFSTAFELREWPFSVTAKGWTSFVPEILSSTGRPPADHGHALFDGEHKPLIVEGNVIVAPGQKTETDARGSEAAHEVCAFLQELTSVPEKQRPSLIEQGWQTSIDAEAIRERAEEADRAARLCQITGQLQFVTMFAGSPILYIQQGPMGILYAIILILAVTFMNGIVFYTGHRKLYPDARGERIRSVLVMIISFPMAARAADILTRKALLRFQAPAVLATLAKPGEENVAALQHWYRDLKYPITFGLADESTREIADTYADARKRRWMAWWETGIAEEWRSPPELEDLDNRLICPRCLTDFDPDSKECPDCPGVPLSRFDTLELN